MFVRMIASIPAPREHGLVLALHPRNREYFLLKANSIASMLQKFKNSISKPFEDPRVPHRIHQYVAGTTQDEWELYYTTDVNDPLPPSFSDLYKLMLVGCKSDAVTRETDSTVYKVTHNFTNLAVYVVDKCTADKQLVLRKVVKQMEKYLTQHGAEFAALVEKNNQLFATASSVFESTYNKTKYSMRDVFLEAIPVDNNFASLTAQCRNLNMKTLRELVS